MKRLLLALFLLSCLAGCADTGSSQPMNSEDITSSVEGDSVWGLDSMPIALQVQEASLLCKEEGGELQVVDTRVASPNGLDSLVTGNVQFMCFGVIR